MCVFFSAPDGNANINGFCFSFSSTRAKTNKSVFPWPSKEYKGRKKKKKKKNLVPSCLLGQRGETHPVGKRETDQHSWELQSPGPPHRPSETSLLLSTACSSQLFFFVFSSSASEKWKDEIRDGSTHNSKKSEIPVECKHFLNDYLPFLQLFVRRVGAGVIMT